VAPGAAHPFANALIQHATERAGHAQPRADHVKVDALLGGIEFGGPTRQGACSPTAAVNRASVLRLMRARVQVARCGT
jgi:hypothetical protein